jgi:Ca2+-binding RTX toxin-like protein
VTLRGGDGNDVLSGGASADTLSGGAGNDTLNGFVGDDMLNGDDGNDTLVPDNGRDTLVGGDGVDTASYGRRTSPSFSLDGQRNDGEAGENDLIATDVENVEAAAADSGQTVTIVGDGRNNRLTVLYGKADITGGEGSDILEGGGSDDRISSRDGSPDTVICNGGTDTVLADTLDLISPSCENVQVQASPGRPV